MKLRFGLIKTSLIDYPGRVAAVLFTSGCNLRCPYCHNPELVAATAPKEFLDAEDVLAFLARRSTVLGGVVITGGEPLIHAELPEMVERIRALGLPVKLDTNGTFPERLEETMPDFIAMDLKCVLEHYPGLLMREAEPAEIVSRLRRSIEWILSSGIPHQFRTTWVPGIVQPEESETLIELIRGADQYLVSGFRNAVTLDGAWRARTPYAPEVLYGIAEKFENAGIPTRVRLNP